MSNFNLKVFNLMDSKFTVFNLKVWGVQFDGF